MILRVHHVGLYPPHLRIHSQTEFVTVVSVDLQAFHQTTGKDSYVYHAWFAWSNKSQVNDMLVAITLYTVL